MIPQAWKAIEYCERGTSASPELAYEQQSRPCRNKNEHALLRAKLFASENKNAEAIAELRKIECGDLIDRTNLIPALVMLLLKTGDRPGPFIGRVLAQPLDPNDIEWMTLLSEKLRPVRPLGADGLDGGALKLMRSSFQNGRSRTENLRKLTARLLVTGKFKEIDDLLNLASKTFEREERHEALVIVSLLRIRSQIEQGNNAVALKQLEKVLPVLRSRGSSFSNECLADALSCEAKIAWRSHREAQAKSIYNELVGLVQRSYDLSANQKVEILKEFAKFCDETGDKVGAKSAVAKCDELAPEKLKELREVSLF
jgi:hypothetical protein